MTSPFASFGALLLAALESEAQFTPAECALIRPVLAPDRWHGMLHALAGSPDPPEPVSPGPVLRHVWADERPEISTTHPEAPYENAPLHQVNHSRSQ